MKSIFNMKIGYKILLFLNAHAPALNPHALITNLTHPHTLTQITIQTSYRSPSKFSSATAPKVSLAQLRPFTTESKA